MGNIDVIAKNFFRSRHNFADLFNFKLYGGAQVIHAEELKEHDSTEIVIPYGSSAKAPLQKFRDNIMLWDWGAMSDSRAMYVLLGIESQADVHYAMPVRDMLYDAMNYAGQVQKAMDSYKSNGKRDKNSNSNNQDDKISGNKNSRKSTVSGLTSAEYLSGFRKSDRLMPVVTVVLYLSPEKWDGPLSIHQMLNIQDPSILQLVPDYTINLLQPADLKGDDFAKFRTELSQVLEYIHYSGDKETLHTIVHKGDRFRNLDRRSADLLNMVTGSELVFDKSQNKTAIIKEGRINVCKAIQDMKKEEREKATLEVLTNDVRNIMESFGVSMDRAMDALKVDSQIRTKIVTELEHQENSDKKPTRSSEKE